MPLPKQLTFSCRRLGVRLPPHILLVWIGNQRMDWLERQGPIVVSPAYCRRRRFVISTSRIGPGQIEGSNRTPIGLHVVGVKIGAGWPCGSVFVSRRTVGFTWDGVPDAPIAHRILWLKGLEPGLNQGGKVDSFRRFIYIHGVGDESGLGQPASIGCIHLAANDLIPLFDRLHAGSLVWITTQDGPVIEG